MDFVLFKKTSKVYIQHQSLSYKERREIKSKGERERYIQLNTDFQRTAWRDKKAFFNEQCIKLEKNNRRGKTRDFFKKTGDIKERFVQRWAQ